LRPGLAGISEGVKVVSIVGRFLEHSRIYYFHNNGAEEYFIGSADCMKRNLESRVEVLVPIEDAAGRQRLRAILDLQLAPNRNAWNMQSDGSYVRARVDSYDRACQQALMDWIASEHANPQPRKKPRARYARRPAGAAVA
jgi:polyphosphate kinase